MLFSPEQDEASVACDIVVPGELDALIVMLERDLVEPTMFPIQNTVALAADPRDPSAAFARTYWLELSRASRCLDDDAVAHFATIGLGLAESALRGGCGARVPALASAKWFINENCRRADLSVDMAARTAGVSVRRLQELFRSEGLTFSRYTLEQRLDRAWAMLRDPSHKQLAIGEIAYAVGFEDPSYFARAFHRRFGLAPRESRSTRRSGR